MKPNCTTTEKSNVEIGTKTSDDNGSVECRICLTDFQVGDAICWSNNPKCNHPFHFTCLEPWLLAHDECPMCRAKYLMPPSPAVN